MKRLIFFFFVEGEGRSGCVEHKMSFGDGFFSLMKNQNSNLLYFFLSVNSLPLPNFIVNLTSSLLPRPLPLAKSHPQKIIIVQIRTNALLDSYRASHPESVD